MAVTYITRDGMKIERNDWTGLPVRSYLWSCADQNAAPPIFVSGSF